MLLVFSSFILGPMFVLRVRFCNKFQVGQIKRGQLTFLLVTSERTDKINRFLAGRKLHRSTS